ncbi:hypothetical protein [Enterovibrio sp. 27052020O]|uniref:hypothetical protein n=1 Tax=Enterovibrio sp. 27052020O TaxID=3241166 RepID=UPI003890BEAB
MKLFENFLDVITSERNQISLFKGSVALATLYLVATIQVINTTLPIEKSAYELKFAVEYSLKKEFKTFENMECHVEHISFKDCKLAKYQHNLSTAAVEALISFQKSVLQLAITLLTLSVFGFVTNLVTHQKESEENSPFYNREQSSSSDSNEQTPPRTK